MRGVVMVRMKEKRRRRKFGRRRACTGSIGTRCREIGARYHHSREQRRRTWEKDEERIKIFLSPPSRRPFQ